MPLVLDGTTGFSLPLGAEIGVGTDTPGGNGLHVDHTAGATLRLTRLGTSTSHFVQLETDGAHGTLRSEGNLTLQSGGANPRITVLSTGNVGIGTNNPSTKLHVDGGGSQPELRVSQNSTYFTDIGINHIDVNGPNDLRFLMGGAQKARLTSGGVLALGSGAPGSWSANYPALTIGQGATFTGHASNTQTQLGQNWWVGTGNQYVVNGAASRLIMNQDSTIKFSQAPSGTAGASISATDVFVIDSSGRVQMGAPISTHIGTSQLFVNRGVNALPATSGTTQTGGALRLRGADNAVLDMGMNSINTWIQATDRANLANGYPLLLNPNGGNVGISVTAPQFKLHVNKGSNTYAPTNGVVENIAGFQTNYDSAGSQILTYANLDGNWVDGTSGANSAFGWLWGYQNNVRGGLVYDHRGTERMQLFSSYGAIALMTPDAADGNGVPTDSNMNERLTILPGGNIGIGITTPAQLLHVQAGSTGNGTIRVGGGAGLDISHDNSGATLQRIDSLYRTTSNNANLQLRTGILTMHTGGSNTERMRLNSDGILTQPYHPNFGAVGFPSHRYMNVWQSVDLHSWNFVYQTNTSHYNNTNGRFTAPVAGMYHFYYHSMFTNPSTNDFHNRLKVNGTPITYSNEHSGGGSGNGHQWNGCSVSMTVNLNVGDYVTADSVGSNSSTCFLYGSGSSSRYSSWGGYLLG